MDQAVVVVDNGSGFVKAGLHTAMEPTCVVPQVVGRPHHRRVATNIREIFVGKSALKMSGVCALSSPSQRGFITSFDDQVQQPPPPDRYTHHACAESDLRGSVHE